MNSLGETVTKYGGILKIDEEGRKIIAFGKVLINQETVSFLASLKDIYGLLFYYCDFQDVKLNKLETLGISAISILHGNFGDRELLQLADFKTLHSLKLHDTKVTEASLRQLTQENPIIKLV